MRRAACLPALSILALLAGAARAEDAPAGASPAGRPAYPATRRTDDKDVLHGVDVPDPYRWLEPNDPPEVEAWDLAQNALLRARLDACPGRAALQERIDQELGQGGIESLPSFGGRFAFHTYRAPGENHPALYVRPLDGQEPPRVVLDPNEWSADGTQGMKGFEPSPDGRYVAYQRDAKGSEDTTLYVHDVQSGQTLPDVITRTKFTRVVWRPDARSFYYTRLPDPDDVPKAERQYHRRVYLHVLGTAVQDDPIVYGQGRPMIESMWVGSSSDEQHRFVVRGIPYETLDVFEVDETWGEPRLVPVLVGSDSRTYVDRTGDVYVLNTDLGAPRRRICRAQRGETENPLKWREIVPQTDGVIESTALVQDRLLVLRRENLVARLTVFDLEGRALGDVELPGPGQVRSLVTRPGDTRVWFSFESYAMPLSTWRVDTAQPPQGEGPAARFVPERLALLPTTLAVDGFVTERFDVASKDGTKIPLFLTHRKDMALRGKPPVVLTGYGGFRVGQSPSFSRAWGLWVEMGGAYAVACLRGGDEFGEEWHAAGCLAKKQNVFDDFIACGDWLVSSGRASRERLAIQGGSNGGLLVAAVANQRPDLCRAVVCSVPLTDMLRFHRFQFAKSWTKEYGDPDVKEEFGWIRPYSPYHNVKPGTAYPAALVTAGLSDGRVEAFHARKIVAQWQQATSSDRPILLYLDRESGHGAASLRQAKRELLDRFCFLRMELGAP